MPLPIDSEKADLREALEGEHRVLKRIQKVIIDALPPDSGKSDADIVSEIWEGTDIDPAPEIEQAEDVLSATAATTEPAGDVANDTTPEDRRTA